MKTLSFKTLMLTTLTFAAFALTACGGSGDSSSSQTASSVIQITPSPATVAPGQAVVITPSGGTAPYAFSLSSQTYGTLEVTSGTYTVFSALTILGSTTLQVTDATGLTNYATITVTNSTGTSTGTSTLSVTSTSTSVVPSGALQLTASGGTAPYYFSVASGSGTFSPATSTTGITTFYAPATAETAYILVSDSAGNSTEVSITVSTSTSTSTASTECSGTYTVAFESNNQLVNGTFVFVVNDNGVLAGSLTVNGGVAALSVTCSACSISFTNEYSGSVFTGTYFTNPNTSLNFMQGTFNDSTSATEPWYATQTSTN